MITLMPGSLFRMLRALVADVSTWTPNSSSSRSLRAARTSGSSSTIRTEPGDFLFAIGRFLEAKRDRDDKLGAAALLVANFDRSLVGLHVAVADREAETHALADGLGGEEGLEDPFARVVREPVTIVGNDDTEHLGIPLRANVD